MGPNLDVEALKASRAAVDATIGETRFKAGQDYLEALEALGLSPDALAWAVDENTNEVYLLLITGYLDAAGPLEVSKQLFRAYNLAATPREVDPFMVKLLSPRQGYARGLLKTFSQLRNEQEERRGRDDWFAVLGTSDGVHISARGVYRVVEKPKQTATLLPKWGRVVKRIDQLAKAA